MPNPNGNPNLKGNKNSGRKTIKEEIEAAKEAITQDALIALANSKVYKQLKKIKDGNLSGFKDTKEMALPITLKGMTEKKELTGDLIVEISETIAKKRGINTNVSSSNTRSGSK